MMPENGSRGASAISSPIRLDCWSALSFMGPTFRIGMAGSGWSARSAGVHRQNLPPSARSTRSLGRVAFGVSLSPPEVVGPLNALKGMAAGTWYLSAIALYPEQQRKGLGRAMLADAEMLAAPPGQFGSP